MPVLHKLQLIERLADGTAHRDPNDVFLVVKPDEWREANALRTVNGRAFAHEGRRLAVMISYTREKDGRRWVHLSVSTPSRVPTYAEMKEVRALFLGTVRAALQLFVTDDEHVNDHPFCLHLWMPVDPIDLPDFRWEDEKGKLSV
jgi:hypothetical protein